MVLLPSDLEPPVHWNVKTLPYPPVNKKSGAPQER